MPFSKSNVDWLGETLLSISHEFFMTASPLIFAFTFLFHQLITVFSSGCEVLISVSRAQGGTGHHSIRSEDLWGLKNSGSTAQLCILIQQRHAEYTYIISIKQCNLPRPVVLQVFQQQFTGYIKLRGSTNMADFQWFYDLFCWINLTKRPALVIIKSLLYHLNDLCLCS